MKRQVYILNEVTEKDYQNIPQESIKILVDETKSINGDSGGTSSVVIVDNFNSTSATSAASARTVKVLNDTVQNLNINIGVNTLADLRAIETPIGGRVIKVQAHNSNGLDKKIGGGYFKFVTTPLFTVNTANLNTGFTSLTTTASTRVLGADITYGDNLYFHGSGETGFVFRNASISNEDYFERAYAEGSTTFRVTTSSQNIQVGDKAYFDDDNGLYILPTDGTEGYWERILGDDKRVSPEMFGAIPNESIYDGSINECSDAIQAAFDSFYPVYTPSGAYYIDKEVYVRRNKTYIFEGYQNMYENVFDRRFYHVDKEMKAVLYTDQNIHMVGLQCNCDFRASFNTKLVTLHNKYAVRMLLAFRHRSNIEIVVVGDTREIQENPGDTGTRAFMIDGQDASFNDVFLAGNGYITSSTFDIKAVGCHTVFGHTDVTSDLGSGIFSNTCKVIIEGIYVKRGVWCDYAFDNTSFEGVVQSKSNCTVHTLAEREEVGFIDTAHKIDSANGLYNILTWDYRGNDNTWTNPAEFVSGPVDLGFITKRELYKPQIGRQYIRSKTSLIAPTAYSPTYSKLEGDETTKYHLIPSLNSGWTSLKDRGNINIIAYRAPVDFNFLSHDTTSDLEATISTTTEITIENAQNLGSPTKTPPTFTWSETSDSNRDFVEVVIDDNSAFLDSVTSVSEVGISISGWCKRLQFIKLNANGSASVFNELVDAKDLTSYLFRFLKGQRGKVIIRFIGKDFSNRDLVNNIDTVIPYDSSGTQLSPTSSGGSDTTGTLYDLTTITTPNNIEDIESLVTFINTSGNTYTIPNAGSINTVFLVDGGDKAYRYVRGAEDTYGVGEKTITKSEFSEILSRDSSKTLKIIDIGAILVNNGEIRKNGESSSQARAYKPIITTEGDQKIYGALEVEEMTTFNGGEGLKLTLTASGDIEVYRYTPSDNFVLGGFYTLLGTLTPS